MGLGVTQLLKWVGNKHKHAEEIISYMPKEFNDYYEPFLGSGAVLAHLMYIKNSTTYNEPNFRNAIAGDILPYVINIFQDVKNEPQRLVDYYDKHIRNYNSSDLEIKKQNYENIKERFNIEKNYLDFMLLSRTCYSGIIRFRKSDGYMSTPVGPHKPISPESFAIRVKEWHELINGVSFHNIDFRELMQNANDGDLIYCDPPYTHSQGILYGAQAFDINDLWQAITDAKERGVKIMLSINGTKKSKSQDISVILPQGLFERKAYVNCGKSMVNRLQRNGEVMDGHDVHDMLLLTW